MSKFFSNKSQISKQIIPKYRNHTRVLYLVAHIEKIFIPAYYEKLIKYFIVHLEYFHSDYLYDIRVSSSMSPQNQICRKWFSKGNEQGENHAVTV